MTLLLILLLMPPNPYPIGCSPLLVVTNQFQPIHTLATDIVSNQSKIEVTFMVVRCELNHVSPSLKHILMHQV